MHIIPIGMKIDWRHEKRALKVKILHFEFLLQVASPTFNEIFVFSMCITFSISIFVLYVPCTKNICDFNMKFFITRRQTRWECIFYISISLPIIDVIQYLVHIFPFFISAVIWPKYCRYGVKHNIINQSINLL